MSLPKNFRVEDMGRTTEHTPTYEGGNGGEARLEVDGGGGAGGPGVVARQHPDLQHAMAAAAQDHELNQSLQESVRDGLSGRKAAKFNSHTQALSARLQGDARTIMEQQGHVRKKIAELQEELDDLDNAHKSLMAAVMSMQGWQK